MNDMQGEVIEVPLEEIDRFVHQSREVFDDEVDGRLADDIKQNGMHQPVVCWLDPHRKRLVLICGERRLRASKRAGKSTISVRVIRGDMSLGQMIQMNLAENIQRASLNPIERGKAFRRLMQLEELNASEVATRMNVTVSMVSRDLSLLDRPEALQSKVAAGELPASVGAHISRIEDEETRRAFAERYRSGELTRDGVAREIKALSRPKGGAAKPQRLAVKFAGLSISVAGKPDKLTIDTLLGVFTRICKEAKTLKDGGKTDVNALAEALRAS
jgi:ParB family chromosome partitioning protein